MPTAIANKEMSSGKWQWLDDGVTLFTILSIRGDTRIRGAESIMELLHNQ